MNAVSLLVGTKKGAFVLRSDRSRERWSIAGPLFKGWEVFELTADPRVEGKWLAATGHFIYGSCVQISNDSGKSWHQIEASPAYSKDAGFELKNIWCIQPSTAEEPGVYYAGVDQAGLFRSEDGGNSWELLDGLSGHASRSEWMEGAGGLCCHCVRIDPKDPDRLWTGISAVGVFRSDDRGKTWQLRNEGLPVVIPSKEHPGIGSCVHGLALDPQNSNRLFQQNHQGVYRSDDGGDHWQRIENGLKEKQFGFPIALDPHDPDTVFIVPQESDEFRHAADGKLTVCRSRDGGDSWQPLRNGLPDHCFTGVLRKAMCTDACAETGVYFGTANGQICYSRNAGEEWQILPFTLPRIFSISAITEA
ncbi:MAG: hypothetical protein R3F19_34540 [Verrucomicrobiales bacterium]